jgi:hypothetical protein
VTEIHRIVLTELLDRPGTTPEVAERCSLTEGEVRVQLQVLNERIRNLLGSTDDAITATSTGTWRADGVAGLLRLNEQVALEVVPKFLDAASSNWRRDFFLLAVLVRTGHLLQQDEIAADEADRGDLATLVAWSLMSMCDENERRPIRRYRRVVTRDFSIDGEVDPVSIALPDPAGYTLARLELTNRNPYNATIAAAAQILAREVSDVDTQARLQRLARGLRAQDAPPRTYPTLPQRHQSWSGAYDLSRLVVEGLGLDLLDGVFTGPGFILSTWQAWEALCGEVLRRALPDVDVVLQKSYSFGTRERGKGIEVQPDISPLRSGAPIFLLDAKYRTRAGRRPSVANGDVYEAFAFLTASGARHIDLLYPATETPDVLPMGDWRPFEKLTLAGGVTVRGVAIQVQGLAQRGGFERLVAGARAALAGRVS